MSRHGGRSDPRSAPAAGSRLATYGRRRGRRLRAGQQGLLQDLLPRLSIELPPEGRRLDLAALFGGAPDALWLEIGFGAGEHLAWQAARQPGTAFIGAEVFRDGIVGLLRSIGQEKIKNIRIFQGDGRDLLEALPAGSLDRVSILFPDPWPKRRHAKRRLVQPQLLDRLADLMAGGAELRLATDHPDYLGWILERITVHTAFDWLARRPGDWRERPADWPATRYERKALEEGRQPSFLRFRRRPPDRT